MVWNPKADHSTPQSQLCKWDLVEYTRGRGIDVGCGAVKPFPHFIGIDTKEFHAGGMTLKPDINMDATDLSMFSSQSLDFVFSSHLLQDVEDYKKVLREMWRVVKPWGHMILYLPNKNLHKVEKKEGQVLPHEFSPEDVIEAMKELKGWNLIRNDVREEGDEYSFFQVYFKLKNAEKQLYSHLESKPAKRACLIRYGAFGDMLQAAPVIAGLKDEGYHVDVYAQAPGHEVLRFDPNIGMMHVQEREQIPNAELGQYWSWLEKKYDKFVNLSETVEGTLLSEKDRLRSKWPTNLRHKLLDYNYVQLQHEVAELKKSYPVRFYAAPEEKEWARKKRSGMGDFVIQWSMAGSAVHKAWPYLDQVIARVMIAHPMATVVLCGGPGFDEILEAGWEKEPRVIRTCGKWSIRQSLAFSAEADLIIGPETGLLNAAAYLDTPKIVFLSHSSVENLTRDWKNTVSLWSKNTSCYPCHILHQGWELCRKDEEKGVAACQSDISADECWDHVNKIMLEKALKAA